jgi:hypothetical protein
VPPEGGPTNIVPPEGGPTNIVPPEGGPTNRATSLLVAHARC